MRYFGPLYGAPIEQEIEHAPVPVGEACGHCGEALEDGDDGFMVPLISAPREVSEVPYHRDCHLRMVIGSVAHIQRRCSCYVPGADELDPPGMTKRQAAQAAVAAFKRVRA